MTTGHNQHTHPAAANTERSEPVQLDDSRVTQALDEYLVEIEAGRRPNRQQLVARFPDIAGELASCLEGLEPVHRTTPLLNEQSPGDTMGPGKNTQSLATLGDYRLIREVGRGGMGVVYEAEQISLGRRVILKAALRRDARRETTEAVQK